MYKTAGLQVQHQAYRYRSEEVANVIADLNGETASSAHYIVGAHYDSVAGTVGADDNASAIAVQLELARALKRIRGAEALLPAIRFVSFALEEPPAFGTRHMGSRVYARDAKKQKADIQGMICLEMVGYTCHRKGCQHFPFPLMFLGYPDVGDFIGIVGNWRSRSLTRRLFRAFQKNTRLPVEKVTVPLGGWTLPSVRLSDHASFWDQGYQAVMVTDSAFFRNPNYHHVTDTMDTLDFQFMAELVASLLLYFAPSHPSGGLSSAQSP
jgi:Zn-dependent M28 family amino/carboxypeptidase